MAAEVQHTSTGNPDRADQVANLFLFPVTVAQRVLPDNGFPVYLGLGALAVVGVIDWPIAAASGLGYAALVRWRRPSPSSTPGESWVE